MNPKQFQQFLISNEDATKKAIELSVNGKIDKMSVKLDSSNEKLDAHIVVDKIWQDKMDDNIKWVVRLILGAVILGIIAMIIK